MINERWPLRPLGDLFEIGAGKTMSAAARDGDGKVPFLRTSNVFWDEIDLSTVDRMAIPPHELDSKLLCPGDLLVCEGGDIGRAAVWNGELEVMSFQNHLHRLRPLADDVEPRFYVYFLQSGFTQLGIFEGAGNRTTIPNLSRNRLASLEVPHPDLDEQGRIVRALASIREGIGVHHRAHESATLLKRAAMRQLFTRGLRGEPQKESEIGLVPESWAVGRLDRYATTISTRMSYSELEQVVAQDENDSVPVLGIKVSDMNSPGNEVELKSAALATRLSRDLAMHRCAPSNTIVFPKRGAAIATNKKRLTTSWTVFDPNIIGVVGGEELDQGYLFQWFQSFDLRTVTEPGPTPQLNKKNLDPLLVPVPSALDEQRDISLVLESIDRKTDLHRRKRAILEELFQTLLHKLMTGEIQVTDLDLSALPPTTSEPAAA